MQIYDIMQPRACLSRELLVFGDSDAASSPRDTKPAFVEEVLYRQIELAVSKAAFIGSFKLLMYIKHVVSAC